MMIPCRLAALGLVLCFLGFGSATANAENATDRYQALLVLARSGQAVDWGALRFAYADSPAYDPLGAKLAAVRHKMAQDFAAEDYAAALADAQKILASDFVDIDAHMISDFADQKLGRADDARREHQIAVGLLKSIQVGDGKSESTAFPVISVEEEHSVMRVLGLDVHDSALVQAGDHTYDKLVGTGADGVTETYYFQIDHIQAAEQRGRPAPPKRFFFF